MTAEIFVSYSQPDRRCAFEVAEYLEANGLKVWIAPRDLSPAAEWAAEIVEAISGARVMVLVFSASSNESPQVRREVERAVNKELRILPFRLEEVLPSRSLEYFLSAHHWLDGFPGPRELHYARLCSALRQSLGEPQPPSVSAVATTPGSPSASPSRAGAGGPRPLVRISSSDLRAVEGHLARVIGPVARVLVMRAADRATDLEDLERQLAAELDSKEDRRRFLEACQWARRQAR